MSKKETTEEVNELEEKQKENEQLFQQLTNKNSEYMVKLNRHLKETSLTEEQKVNIYNDMLKTLVNQQGNHLSARRLYGTVTARAQYLTENPEGTAEKEVTRSETWKLYLDGALLLGGLFAIISGLPTFFNDDPTAGLGLISMLLTYLLGGLAVLVITKYAPVPGVKGGFLKYILATTLTMLVWIVLMGTVTALVPPVFNVHIPGMYTVIIGAVSLAAKWYLKRKLNIQGTLI